MILKFEEFINEAKSNYKTREFFDDVIKLGYEITNSTDGNLFVKYITTKDGKKHKLITKSHIHNNEHGKCVDPGLLRDFRDLIKDEYYLTGDYSIVERTPFEKWDLNRPTKEELDNPTNRIENKKNTDEAQILWAKNRYNKCKFEPLSNYIYDAGDMQIMMRHERNQTKYNICMSLEDMRPLSKIWFDDIWSGDEELKSGFGLAKIVNKRGRIAVYQVTKDGISENPTKVIAESKFIKNLSEYIND